MDSYFVLFILLLPLFFACFVFFSSLFDFFFVKRKEKDKVGDLQNLYFQILSGKDKYPFINWLGLKNLLSPSILSEFKFLVLDIWLYSEGEI